MLGIHEATKKSKSCGGVSHGLHTHTHTTKAHVDLGNEREVMSRWPGEGCGDERTDGLLVLLGLAAHCHGQKKTRMDIVTVTITITIIIIASLF